MASIPIKKKHVFIIGSKGIPATYGGFESFIEKLTLYKKDVNIQYHVACMFNNNDFDKRIFTYNEARCINFKVYNIGSIKAITYDIDSLKYFINYAKINKIEKPIFYVLACRIGPIIKYFKRHINSIGGNLFVNPDGHEWKRGKWSFLVRKYWKLSEQLMVKYADMLICDSKNIEKYINDEYKKYKPKTIFIAYGSETRKSLMTDNDEQLLSWYREKSIVPKQYYLIVGRFIPENNYKTMIYEFMKSKTNKDLAIITGSNPAFLRILNKKLNFDKDPRIKLVGTVYDQELLMKIRENAYGYFHGHEVGGTNPSLLEALAATELNLLLDVGFNREVGENGALYWTKENGNLANLIEMADGMKNEEIKSIGILSKNRISEWYSWNYIIDEYESLFKK